MLSLCITIIDAEQVDRIELKLSLESILIVF
jgi:hypothetical protein